MRAVAQEEGVNGRHRGMSFPGLVVHNLATRRVRTALTALAVAISVMAVVTLGVVTSSLEGSAAEVLSAGKADFTVAQKSVADVLSSIVTDSQVARIGALPGVKSAIGVLVNPVRLDADHPMFLEIGVDPAELAPFGVTVESGRAYSPTGTHQVMLGWQIADNLGKKVGDQIVIDGYQATVVGIYTTGQVFADSASMFPLVTLQAMNRTPGAVTLAEVQVTKGTSVPALRARIEHDFPSLATVRLVSEFGRVDRNLQFLKAAQTGARIISLVIGVIIVMNTMLLSFVERIREFGVLRAIGWSRPRLLSLVLGEAIGISLLGAAAGVVLAFGLTVGLEHLSTLRGVLKPNFDAGVFWTALYSAASIGILAALYPSARAALLRPGVALRRE